MRQITCATYGPHVQRTAATATAPQKHTHSLGAVLGQHLAVQQGQHLLVSDGPEQFRLRCRPVPLEVTREHLLGRRKCVRIWLVVACKWWRLAR